MECVPANRGWTILAICDGSTATGVLAVPSMVKVTLPVGVPLAAATVAI